jgi:general secretion pathway protein D
MVQMRAPKAVLDEANDIIQRVADIASRRLLLEARVLAVSRTRSFDQQSRLRVGGKQDGTNLSGSFMGSVTAALTRDLATYNGANLSTIGGISAQSPNLDAVLGILEKYGTTYELMHPMMELMDRQRATLIDGRNEKYFIVKSTTTTATATSTASDVEERNQFLGLQFSASAQVSGNTGEPHTIALQIPITSLAKTVDVPSGTSGTIAGVAPVANTRLIDQKVRIRDGEIKVIGGLTKTIAVDSESGIPLLREIPAFGKLANEQGITFDEVEFVVLLQVKRLN